MNANNPSSPKSPQAAANPSLVAHDTLAAEVLSNTTDGVFVLDYNWRFIYLNATARELISPGHDVMGANVWDEYPAAMDSLFWNHYHRTMEERIPCQFESFYPAPLNAWFEVHSYPTLRGMSVFFRDITKRKFEEERLHLLEQAIASAPMGISIAEFKSSNDCPIIYVNPAFEELTGYKSADIVGSDCRILQGTDAQQPGRFDLQNALEQSQPSKTVLRNYRKDGTRFFNEVHLSQVYDQSGNVSHIVGIQNDVTKQLETEAKLARQAEYDSLTGLANRYLLTDRLKEALAAAERDKQDVAVVIIDLDNFKHINDRFGHIEADRVLIQLARRLHASVERGDTVARLGGDEFALILTQWTDQARLHKQMERLLHEIKKPVLCGGQEMIVTGSCGVSVFPGNSSDPSDPGALLKMADVALYWIKGCGKNSFRIYDSELRLKSDEPMDVAVGFRKALQHEEFVLYYQPRVDAKTKRTVGLEALIRWQHPERGLLLPSQFIRVAEDTGLINDIGAWVLGEALRQNAAWRAEGLEPVVMSVNVSPAQIRNPEFTAVVARALASTGLPPESLELELTESILIDNAELAEETLQALKQLGVRIAIDDFGAGCSSLQYLSRFPVDTIKIDHFFTRNIATNPRAAAICRSVLQLGQALGMVTVAEGVETTSQVALLRLWRCHEFQGFMFARPLASGEAGVVLAG